MRSTPGRWQSRQLGLPLGGPQPSQLIHPRAGDSGQRDRLETTQDAGRDLPPPTAACARFASNGRARSGLASATETERGRRKNKEKSVEI